MDKVSKTTNKVIKYAIMALFIVIAVSLLVIIMMNQPMKISNIKTNVSEDLISPLGNRTILDLSEEGDFVFQNAGSPESFTYGGKTIKLNQFTQRTDVTVEELSEYLADLSNLGVINKDKSTNLGDYEGELSIDSSIFAEKLNEYIENDMSAENNRYMVTFENGSEIEITSHVHTTDIEHSDCVDETIKDRPNKIEVYIIFSPKNTDGEPNWNKDNTFVSYVGLRMYNSSMKQEYPYGVDGRKTVDTYINYGDNISVLIWKIGFMAEA